MDEDKNCSDKLTFDTKRQADTAKLVAEHQRGAKLKSYQCRECGLWHLSSKYRES